MSKNTKEILMIEGWHNDDYLFLFDLPSEAEHMNCIYGVSENLPGYSLVGLWGWDDFIVTDCDGNFFILPTVPFHSKNIEPFSTQWDTTRIKPDERFSNKVKWYVKPLLFGGNPTDPENLIWVTFEQHAELVRWWAKVYRDMTA